METTRRSEAFIRSPKFLRKLIPPSAVELYALLKEKRDSLVKAKHIKDNNSWFFYRINDLREDLVSPNSVNSIKRLADHLEKIGVLRTRIQDHPYTIKEYNLDDDAYIKLEKQHHDIWKRKIK